MEFSTTDWVAFVIIGASALVGTFGKRLVRIIGLAVMPFAFAGLILMFLTSSDRRGCFSMQHLGLNWRASYQPGNLLRLWLLDLEPIGILQTNMPNI
jgi:energy-coupling factor transporter transmembrane protein EcfT